MLCLKHPIKPTRGNSNRRRRAQYIRAAIQQSNLTRTSALRRERHCYSTVEVVDSRAAHRRRRVDMEDQVRERGNIRCDYRWRLQISVHIAELSPDGERRQGSARGGEGGGQPGAITHP